MKKIWLLVLTIAVCAMCMFAASACSSGDKYGEAGTYYDLNSGNTFYFDGNGKCDYAGINCTYYIEDSIYYYISHGDTTLTYKKVNDGVLVETFKNAPIYLSITASSSNGRISGNITYGSTLIYFYIDGTYQEFSEYTLVGTGNYYFNEGVLVQEQTLGMTSGGSWSSNIVYYGYYVNEETGQLSGVMLADPDHYKQWHSDNNNNGETEDDNEDDIPVYTPHTLTYDLNYDGATTTTQQVVTGENVKLITPERQGYEFSGWYYNGNKITDGVWKYDGDITLTARWEIIYYSVTYNTDGGTMPDNHMETFTVESNLPYTLPVPVKQGHNFAGWYENADLSGQPITEIPENGLRDYTLYAKYTVDRTPHTLTYDLNYDGAPLITQQVIKGENVNMIAPERRGYEFSGWYYNGNKITDGVWKYDDDITITARWEIIYYSVTYNTDGGTMPDSFMRTFTAESELPYTLPVPKKLGYDFAGWYENADLSGQSITEIPENGLRDYTLYAKYTVDNTPHTLTYDLNYNGAPTTTQQVITGENVKLITPERRGYEFSGWYYNGNKITDGVWKYDGDITLTARWKIINYSVTYNTDGGTMPNNHMETFTVESNLPYTLPIPVKQGYNFAGWYENADLSGQPITEIPENSLRDYTLYAKYTDEPLLEFELSFDETYYCVVGYKGSPQYITIPDMNDGLPVKEISAKAFYGCDTLISITLPDGITAIGNNAFYSCGKLASIVIPDSVTTIGDSAFYNCNSLTGITIPDSVTTIGDMAFYNCNSLDGVYITDIAAWCAIDFGYSYYANPIYYAHNLYLNGELVTELVIPDSVTSIGNYAFHNCRSLTSITIPDSVTTIGDSAFYNCYSLTSITIPDSVRSIGNIAFPEHLYKRYNDCYYLPTKNSEYGFLYAPIDRDIVNVRIHADCKTINAGAFSSCGSLTNVIIPDSVTTIGDSAFRDCNNLTSVTIGNSVTTIGDGAFSFCDSLEDVYITDIAAWCAIDFGDSSANPIIYNAHNLYLNGELVTELVIPDGVTSIGNYAFHNCSSLTSITIPDSVTTIGDNAFYNCYSLTSITIPDSVTTIGDEAFYSCNSLSRIFYKGSAESWDDITFGEDALSYVKIYYFTETEPTDDGNYWHYDTDGKTPVIW